MNDSLSKDAIRPCPHGQEFILCVQCHRDEIDRLRAEVTHWQKWTQGHVWIRNEEYAELCALKRAHGPYPPEE